MSLSTRGQLMAVCLAVSLGGCGYNARIVGIRPVYPVVRMGGVDHPGKLLFVPVDSVQPTLKWERPPPPPQATSQSVSYDLRIWAVSGGCPGEQAYSRDSLAGVEHRVQVPLRPATDYFWSVRSRFTVAGETRVGAWAYSYHPWSPPPPKYKLTIGIGTKPAETGPAQATSGSIPCDNYFRFRTP